MTNGSCACIMDRQLGLSSWMSASVMADARASWFIVMAEHQWQFPVAKITGGVLLFDAWMESEKEIEKERKTREGKRS